MSEDKILRGLCELCDFAEAVCAAQELGRESPLVAEIRWQRLADREVHDRADTRCSREEFLPRRENESLGCSGGQFEDVTADPRSEIQ